MTPNAAVAILVVSYNTRDLTLACLESVQRETTELPYECLVVDNASSDGSASAVRERCPRCRVLEPCENLGFAGANNLAARETAAPWLLLLNPDTVVLDRAIDRLVAFAEEHGGPQNIYGGRTFYPDGTLNPSSCWGRPTPWSMLCIALGLSRAFPSSRLLNPEAFGDWPRDTIREVDIVSGCFLLVHRTLWNRLGGFSPEFFMYGEDADLCLRARALGARALICPEATIVHLGGASEKVRADKMLRLFEAKARLAARHWRGPHRRLAPQLLDLWVMTRLAAFGMLRIVRPSASAALRTWKVIWAGRDRWRRGIRNLAPNRA